MAIKKVTKEMVIDSINEHENITALINDNTKTVRTGYHDLDKMIGGLRKRQTYLLAARPSMGKTAFALNLVRNVAVDDSKRVVYFSLQSSYRKVIRYLANNICPDAPEKIDASEFYIDDTPEISADEIISTCTTLTSAGKNIDLVIIDYLQLISKNVNERINVLRELAALSERINCAIIILSQLNRSPEERQEHRPLIGDLMEPKISRVIDNILFLYRDEYYDKESSRKGIAEIIVAQCKDWNRGTIELAWIPDKLRFSNLELVR